jgi:hypothetical protein
MLTEILFQDARVGNCYKRKDDIMFNDNGPILISLAFAAIAGICFVKGVVTLAGE